MGEDDPQTRREVMERCATDPEALAFWTSPDRTPDPRQALYQAWLSGVPQERVLLTLDPAQVQEAVSRGAVSRDLAQTSVLLLVRVPKGEAGPGAVGLLAVPRDRYADFSPMAAVEALGALH